MSVKRAAVKRINQLCQEQGIKLNNLATEAGLTPSTLYSIMDEKHHDIGIVTIKKICDGLGVKLAEFFDAPEFNNLQQEIK